MTTAINTPTATDNTTATGTRTAWQLDPGHTLVEFSAKHMMVSTVKGHFSGVEGTLLLDENDLTGSKVDVTIDTTTLETRMGKRDEHLRSADFFAIDEYPTITFQSTRIEAAGTDRYKVYGDLTIRGVSREVVLDAEFEGRQTTPWGGEVIGFEATTRINRKDWGLNWNVALETGGLLVGEEVKITIHTEANPQQ